MKLSRRKLLGGAAIAGASAMGGAGTMAYLSDQDSVMTQFETGDLEVVLNKEQMEFQGEDGKIKTGSVKIKNNGSLKAGKVCLKAASLNGHVKIAEAAEIRQINYRGTDITTDVEDQIDRSPVRMDQLANYLNNNEVCLEEKVGSSDGLEPDESTRLEISAEIDYEKVSGSGPYTLEMELVVTGRQAQ